MTRKEYNSLIDQVIIAGFIIMLFLLAGACGTASRTVQDDEPIGPYHVFDQPGGMSTISIHQQRTSRKKQSTSCPQ